MKQIPRRAAACVALALLSLVLSAHGATPTLKRSNAATTAAAPSTVGNVIAGANVAYDWTSNVAEQRVTGYRFYERVGGSYNLLGTIASNSFTVSNIAAGTHYFVVTAYRDVDGAESAYSNEVAETVDPPLPPLTPPQNLHKSTATNGIANVSTRAQVGIGENVLIAGFIITGDEKIPLIIRAIGPTLTSHQIAGALIDPMLEVRNANGELIAANDNWQENPEQKAALQNTGLAPNDYREAAIALQIDPGAYTAILRGKYETTGVAVVEVYRG